MNNLEELCDEKLCYQSMYPLLCVVDGELNYYMNSLNKYFEIENIIFFICFFADKINVMENYSLFSSKIQKCFTYIINTNINNIKLPIDLSCFNDNKSLTYSLLIEIQDLYHISYKYIICGKPGTTTFTIILNYIQNTYIIYKNINKNIKKFLI